MPGRGLEPLILAEPDPKSGASANFATPAYLIINELQLMQQSELARVLHFVILTRTATP